MLQHSLALLRRGKPRPTSSFFPPKFLRVPAVHKPHQGGQNYFQHFLLRNANEEAQTRERWKSVHGEEASSAEGGAAADYFSSIDHKLPQGDFAASRMGTEEAIKREIEALQSMDEFQRHRGFNERDWYDQQLKPGAENEADKSSIEPTEQTPDAPADESAAAETALPDNITDNEYFKSRFGYSLVKEKGATGSSASSSCDTSYSQLDMWAEMPNYRRGMYFLYLVSRRRNTYAVMFNFEGKRMLPTYTAGNRGLKVGDKGFRGDGSAEVAHQVTSQYLNDVIPKIREAENDNMIGKGKKIELTVRVMGFYNGRQGAVRAVSDRSDFFDVRYFEDITPFPLNGPRMPKHFYK